MKPIIAVPAILILVWRARRKNSLTPAGILAAIVSAAAHAYHPWNLPFALLVVFFLAGTRVTRIKKNVKATLTMHSRGTSGGEGPRTHVQVFANSLMGSILSLLHAYQLRSRAAAFASSGFPSRFPDPQGTMCFSWGGDLLVVGIIANYAAVAADTFSSELGILSKSSPRLITSLTLRKVPPGTNGGVTLAGLAAGFLGSMIMATTAMMFIPACGPHEAPRKMGGGIPWTTEQGRKFLGFLVVWGALGSLLDSFLGGLLQRSVRDVRSGKIVEGEGGSRVLVSSGGERVVGGSTKRADAKEAAMSGESSMATQALDKPAVDDQEETEDQVDPADQHRKLSFSDERPSRVVESGRDLLDNNDVNFLMASMMSVGAMALAKWYWDVPIENVIKP
ncbi:hypothetical protein HIM_02327 [Hirsutella minnesotensis 3608]|nr:hypothetical protein HIM_02327 [Hirsutella minnesotensis 3608]